MNRGANEARIHWPGIRHVLAAMLLAVLAGGCAVQQKSMLNPETQRNVAITHEQFRLRMRTLVDPICGQLEATADSIIVGTADRKVQLAALTWEIEGVPALREALYEPEPLIAGVDALTLCTQMADFFETGAGKAAMGPASPNAAETCRRMADQIDRALVSVTVSGDIPRIRAFVKKWSAEHPIQHSVAERQSVLVHMTDYQNAEGLSVGQTVTELGTTLDDLNRKLDVYSAQLIRQARWEIQRFKLEWGAALRLEEAVPLAERAVKSAEQAAGTVDRLSPEIERSLAVAQSTPALVASEREAALNAVHEELNRTYQFVRGERVAALEQLTRERGLAVGDLNDIVVQQRKQLAVDAEQIAARQIDYAVRQVTRVLTLAMTAALLMVVVGVLFVRWLPVRRAAASGVRRINSRGPTAPERDATRIGRPT